MTRSTMHLSVLSALLGLAPLAPVVMASNVLCDVIEDFNGPGILYSPLPETPPEYGVWYDVCPLALPTVEQRELEGSPAMGITDGGWTNGVYAIFPNVFRGPGVYHVEVRMHVIELGVTDGIMAYQVGVAVPGAHRSPSSNLAPCAIVGNYQGLASGNDTAKGPQTVWTQEFEAQEGQDILIAFSTDVTTGQWNANSSSWGGWSGTYVLIDDIRVCEGPHVCCATCDEIEAVNVLGPLVAGDTAVRVGGVGTAVDYVTVYVNDVQKGQLDARALGGGTQVVTISEPLVRGDVVRATQSYPMADETELEGCAWTTDATAGSGLDPGGIRLTVGLRETRTSAPVGGDGGLVGPIEWLGATTIIDGAPRGKLISPSREWQTVVFNPATDPILPGTPDANGILDCGLTRKCVLESLAVVRDSNPPDTGPYTLYIDNIASGTTMIAVFDDYPAGTEQVFFRTPRYLSAVSDALALEPNVCVVDANYGDASSQSLRVGCQFADEATNRWLRLTTYSLYGVPSSYLPNPTVRCDQPITLRILYLPGSAADFDQDGDVDLLDFVQFRACFNGPNRLFPNVSHCTQFDTDDDTDVDLEDFVAFRSSFNGPNRPARQ